MRLIKLKFKYPVKLEMKKYDLSGYAWFWIGHIIVALVSFVIISIHPLLLIAYIIVSILLITLSVVFHNPNIVYSVYIGILSYIYGFILVLAIIIILGGGNGVC